MKVVVIGGTGLIGSKVVSCLREHGHDAVPASPNTGVNTITGEGLAGALTGAAVVVDVSNSPSFEDTAVLRFFETSTRNLLAAESAASVHHHVALSIVKCDQEPDSGYMRAKVAQETLIRNSGIPYSIVRATQFFEFLKGIADAGAVGNTVRIPPVLFQPIASDDVASAVCSVAMGPPVNGIVEVAGPQQFRFDEFIRRGLEARHDPRHVVSDPQARYFGALLTERMLVPDGGARLGEIRFEEWLSRSSAPVQAQEPTVTPVTSEDLPDIPGKEMLILSVDYAPGAADAVHRHNADALVYVLEGSVIEQVKGGQPVTLTAGQTFHEGPDDIHVVGRNASSTKPAKLLAILVKDKGAPALVPVRD